MADTIPILTEKTEGAFIAFDKTKFKKEYREKMMSTKQLRKKFDPAYDIAGIVFNISEKLDDLINTLKRKTKVGTDLPVSEGIDQDKNNEDDINKFFEKGIKDINPRKDALLRAGSTGASAVYIGEKLDEINKNVEEQKEQNKKGFLDKLKNIFGSGGMMMGGMAKLFGSKAMKLGGIAGFAALKWNDITEGMQLFASGDFKKGIETLLLGSRDKVNTENANMGILKQAGAWGSIGMSIGGPWGLLIGAAAGGIAKAIQTGIKVTQDAFEQEWDKNIVTIMQQKKEALANASGFKEKFKANSDLFWTGLGSVFAGAKRAAKKAEEEGNSRFIGWFSGFFETTGNLIEGLLPPEKAKQWREIKSKMKARRKELFNNVSNFFNKSAEYGKDFFHVLQTEGLSGIGNTQIVKDAKEAAKQAWQGFTGKVVEGWNTAKEGWNSMVSRIKEEGLGNFIKRKLEEFSETMKKFGETLKSTWSSISDFIGQLTKKMGQTIRTKWVQIFKGSYGAIEDILQRQSKGKLTDEESLTQLSNIGGFRRFMEEQSGLNLFNMAGGLKKGMEDELQQAMKTYMPDLIRQIQEESMNNITQVNDAIIKPSGQIIKTNPNDTITATQNPGSSNNIINNFTNRYSPQYVMERLRTVEVY